MTQSSPVATANASTEDVPVFDRTEYGVLMAAYAAEDLDVDVEVVNDHG